MLSGRVPKFRSGRVPKFRSSTASFWGYCLNQLEPIAVGYDPVLFRDFGIVIREASNPWRWNGERKNGLHSAESPFALGPRFRRMFCLNPPEHKISDRFENPPPTCGIQVVYLQIGFVWLSHGAAGAISRPSDASILGLTI